MKFYHIKDNQDGTVTLAYQHEDIHTTTMYDRVDLEIDIMNRWPTAEVGPSYHWISKIQDYKYNEDPKIHGPRVTEVTFPTKTAALLYKLSN